MTSSDKGARSTAALTWKASAESEAKAKKTRLYAVLLWALGIAIEIGAIFGLLLNKSILEEKATVDAKGVLITDNAFPTWAFALLIGCSCSTRIAVIIGSMLWKKANQLDPASEKETFRFFIQNQLGAFIPIIAFLPIIILIFLNKDMGKTQKGVAGAVGIVVALAAVALGIDFNPASVEKYTAEKQAVIQLLGEDKVYYAGGGEVYHVCGTVSDLSGSDGQVRHDGRRGRRGQAASDAQDRIGAGEVRSSRAQQPGRDRRCHPRRAARRCDRTGPAVA